MTAGACTDPEIIDDGTIDKSRRNTYFALGGISALVGLICEIYSIRLTYISGKQLEIFYNNCGAGLRVNF